MRTKQMSKKSRAGEAVTLWARMAGTKWFLPEVTALAEEKLGLAEGELHKDPRSLNILRHYAEEVQAKHMGLRQAVERAVGDIQGQSYFKKETKDATGRI